MFYFTLVANVKFTWKQRLRSIRICIFHNSIWFYLTYIYNYREFQLIFLAHKKGKVWSHGMSFISFPANTNKYKIFKWRPVKFTVEKSSKIHLKNKQIHKMFPVSLTSPVHMHTALSISKIWLFWIPLGESHFGSIRPKPVVPLKDGKQDNLLKMTLTWYKY